MYVCVCVRVCVCACVCRTTDVDLGVIQRIQGRSWDLTPCTHGWGCSLGLPYGLVPLTPENVMHPCKISRLEFGFPSGLEPGCAITSAGPLGHLGLVPRDEGGSSQGWQGLFLLAWAPLHRMQKFRDAGSTTSAHWCVFPILDRTCAGFPDVAPEVRGPEQLCATLHLCSPRLSLELRVHLVTSHWAQKNRK